MSGVTTVITVSNLHCPSCSRSISDILLNLRTGCSTISTRINGKQVTIHHGRDVPAEEIVRSLLDAGFEIDSITNGTNTTTTDGPKSNLFQVAADRTIELEDARRFRDNYMFHGMGNDQIHLDHCDMCRQHSSSPGGPSSTKRAESSRPNSSIDRSSRRVSRLSWLYDGTMWFSSPGSLETSDRVSSYQPALQYGSTAESGEMGFGSVPNFSRPGVNVLSRPVTRITRSPVSEKSTTSSQDVDLKTSSDISQEKSPILPQKPTISSTTRSISSISTPSSHDTTEHQYLLTASPQPDETEEYQVTLSIEGMTCASCTNKVTETLQSIDWVRDINISLMTQSGTMVFDAKKSGGKDEGVRVLIDEVECLGYNASLHEIKRLPSPQIAEASEEPRVFEAVIAIMGMTCASCSGKVAESLEAIPWVKEVNINLMTHSGTVRFDVDATGGEKRAVDTLVDEIECLGYDASLDTLKDLTPHSKAPEEAKRRNIALTITGLHDTSSISMIEDTLRKTYPPPSLEIEEPPTMRVPILYISYAPKVPEFTIRHIIATLKALDPAFDIFVYHPPSIEERAQKIQRRERHDLLLRLLVCLICAIPTFLIGIVWMTLVSPDNAQRVFFEQKMWAGEVTRIEWALLILSTPVMVYCAYPFHRRAVKEIVAMWRRGSHVPVLRRFYRFGSMNLLISLGVTVSYVSSVVMLVLGAVRREKHHDEKMNMTTYFDSTVFLTLFLLSVSLITKLRPTEAILITPEIEDPAHPELAHTSKSPIEDISTINSTYIDNRSQKTRRIPADLIEAGDTVCIPHGSSPPADCTITTGESSFDESTLTGESLLVPKMPTDQVYAGTINHGQVVNAVVDKPSGESLIDAIVNVVREGQNRHAPLERIADQVTAYFVPTICALAVITWAVWLSLGVSGVLPDDYLDTTQGGWYFWSLSFAIAVFVVACPCGIGLAAPCAMHVGSSLAARNGILAKGGGEAFQEAARLDVVVFDKTGTLTLGVEPVVSSEQLTAVAEEVTRERVYFVARALEENSVHPLARAIVKFTDEQRVARGETLETREVPGKGSRGNFRIEGEEYEAVIGNERFMDEHHVLGVEEYAGLLESWKMEGNSVILLAICSGSGKELDGAADRTRGEFKLAAMFATTDPIRREAPAVIQALKNDGIDVWMITGDNALTAAAVAAKVGINQDNIIAGVLPTEKADQIALLQSRPSPRRRLFHPPPPTTITAMIGDGINDAPALSRADVGISIGSGSDIALQTSSFILVSSDLRSLYTLTQLSKAVIRRVKFNFLWACVFNVCAIPLAAGVLYPLKERVRLEPVWAALVMAASSVGVVGSSLLLGTRVWGVGWRGREVKVV
ncbi:heavy metal translocatin [Ascodesmis nigricans]|uniref:Heavy metal translocatin n=1 Tax=Ascodesmis nigricans TaxID=341454 RepID=A0A4S2N0P2_9PEZI|nr:heavy metal translocatin [Ascodesmis nigricans]